LHEKGELAEAIETGHRGLVYVVEGEVDINGHRLTTGQACFIEAEDKLLMKAKQATRLMLCFGQPHGEPIRQYGPYVD